MSLLLSLLILSFGAVSASAAPEITIGTVTGAPGENVDVTVTINDEFPALSGGQVDFGFDGDALEFVSGVAGDGTWMFPPAPKTATPSDPNTQTGEITIQLFGEADALPASTVATLATITLKINATAALDTDYTLTYLARATNGLFDNDVNTVTATGNNGSVFVKKTNIPPVATGGNFEVNEDEVATGTLVATDDDGDTLTYSVGTDVTNGQLAIVADTGAYTYTPNANYFGNDSFTFSVNDGTVDSNIAEMTIVVNGVVDDPVAAPLTLDIQEDAGKQTGTLEAADADGDALTYSITQDPTLGTVSITNTTDGSFEYTPGTDKNGTDTFKFQVTDGSGTSDALVTINIAAVNDAPTATAAEFSVTQGQTATGQLEGNDVDTGDTLTFTAVDQPTKGTLTLSADGSYEYKADATADITDGDSFKFKVSDGTLSSADTKVTITLNLSNVAPVATEGLAVATTEDVDGTVELTATDADGDTLTYTIVAVDGQQTKGVATVTGTTATYTPNANENGIDTFTFQVSDGELTDTAVVNVTITAVNDAPEATEGLTLTTDEDTDGTAELTATDADGDTLTYSIVAGEGQANGTATVSGTTVTYTPNANVSGTDSFTFKVADATDEDTATVAVTINAVNDDPVASDGTMTVTLVDPKTATVELIATDEEGDPLTYTIVAGEGQAKGTATVSGTTATYTANADATIGDDSFMFQVDDNNGGTDTATVAVTVETGNISPVATAGSVEVTVGDPTKPTTSGQLAGTDADGTIVSYALVTGAGKGFVELTNTTTGAFTYEPRSSTTATDIDSFTFTVTDNLDAVSDPATVDVTFIAVYTLDLSDGAFQVEPGLSVTGKLDVTYDGPGTLVYSVTAAPTKGRFTSFNDATGDFTYKADADATGTDPFTVEVTDGTKTDTGVATVTFDVMYDATVTVSPVAGGTATLDKTEVTEGESVTLTVNAATGYNVTGVTANGTAVNPVGNAYTVYNVTANQTFAVTFELAPGTYDATFTMTPAAGAGTATLDKTEVLEGESVTLTVNAATGYEVAGVTANGTSVTPVGNAYTVYDVTANQAFAVTFEEEIEDDSSSADQDGDFKISLSEMLRVQQLYITGAYYCDPMGEDGYAAGDGDHNCTPHTSDYNDQDWKINLSEFLRITQFYNLFGYHVAPAGADTEDGFVAGPE